MLFWIHTILVPYIRKEWKYLFDENASILLIFDWLKSYTIEDITLKLIPNNIKIYKFSTSNGF